MNRRINTILILAVVIIMTVIVFQPAWADRPVMVTICHATSSAGNPWVEITAAYPAIYGSAGHFSEPGSPNAGHEQDYEGPCAVVEPTATPIPEPTATEEPTDKPTCEELQNCETPTEEPTTEPIPTNVGPTPTDPVDPTPTEPGDPEPTVVPENTPCPSEEPCGWMFTLELADGRTVEFASFSPRPDGGWYLPNSEAVLRCTGSYAVAAHSGRPLYGDEILLRCMGGACLEPRQ